MKASWNNAAVMRPAAVKRRYKPSMLTNHVPGIAVRPRGHIPLDREPLPFREPQTVDFDQARWFAVRVAHARERPLQAELEAIGFQVYCPLVTKWAWRNGNRTRDKRQTPLFARYLFVGCAEAQHISRHTVDGIEAVLGRSPEDTRSRLLIPRGVLAAINALEVAGNWDETIEWSPDKSPFQHGKLIRFAAGAFVGLNAMVDAPVSEKLIRVLITLFGRETKADFEAANLELV